MEKKSVAIIGAGVSGIMACKYAVEKGFDVNVFEAEETIGGVWAHTLETTQLQTVKELYQFSDFPWPSSVRELHPTHSQVMDYLGSYVKHFNLYPHIRLSSKILSLNYIGESEEEMESWHFWGGTGTAFSSKGKWDLKVQDTRDVDAPIEVHEADFVILCIGPFSSSPHIPKFEKGSGPSVFKGTVLHSQDYAAMPRTSLKDLIEGKRVTIVGSYKSAVDIAAECASINGPKVPCRLIVRTPHWMFPSNFNKVWGLSLAALIFSRFSELTVHKPGESLTLSILATLLSPVRWLVARYIECFLRWNIPMKKHGMLPREGFFHHVSGCQIGMLPENFYSKVEKGSILLQRVEEDLRFCEEGLIVDKEMKPADVVIFATGYEGHRKLSKIFECPVFQLHMAGSPDSILPLYRKMINPRIPRLAVIGFSENYANMFTSEIECQWLVSLLAGKVQLPSMGEMEEEIKLWGDYLNKYSGRHFRKSCVTPIHIWYIDQLCRDMGCNPKRKGRFLADLFQPYNPTDYVGLA